MATDILGTPPADPERIVMAPWRRYPLPDGELLLIREGMGTRSRVSRRVARLLARCTTMRTLDEHAGAIAAELPHLVRGHTEARDLLVPARDAGLFISSREIESAVTAAPHLPPDPAPGWVCVVTRDRPALLERAIESILTGEPRPVARGFWVVDDSRDTWKAESNRTLTRDAAVRHDVPLRYFGLQEQRSAVGRLSRALPEHASSVEFLLARQQDDAIVSHGRALNFALLLSSGETLVQVDDDVICRACPPPMGVSRTMRSGTMVRKAAFFGSADEREAHCLGMRTNPVAPMDGYVGEGLAAVAAALRRREGVDLRFEGMTAVEAMALLSGSAHTTACTCGVYGDPGTTSPSWMFELDADSVRRLAGERDRYRAALSHRNGWIGTDSYHVTREHGMLSPLRALDHRTPLPPFFPLFRGEDYLLSRLLPLADRDAWFLEFPWAVPHLPERPRRWPPDLLDRPETLSFALFSGMLWTQLVRPPLSGNVAHRLELIGGQIRDMGESDATAIGDAMSNCLCSVQSSFIRVMERQLQAGEDLPPWYGQDLARLIDANRRALETPGEPSLSDLTTSGRHPGPRTLELWREFGAALQAWPAILDAASHLREPARG